jgi:hypothetical protein
MVSKNYRTKSGADLATNEMDGLFLRLVKHCYVKKNRASAEKVALQIEKLLPAYPEFAGSIRGEEVRSLIAELRGDLLEAVRSREAEIRKILELHALSVNTPDWQYVSRQYDFTDVSDRLDLLAVLYDQMGELDRAIAVLEESKEYCAAHRIPFDGHDIFEELQQLRDTKTQPRSSFRKSRASVRSISP